MIWLLGGYLWLFVHRPFEVWPWLGDLQIERAYMILMLVYWLVQPNKGFVSNRLHVALAAFTVVLVAAWIASPYISYPSCQDVVENYFKVAVFYILVVTSVRDEQSLRKLLLMYLAVIGLYMGHSLLEYMNGRCIYRMNIRRMVGVDTTFGEPNEFASGLIYVFPLTLPFWADRPSWRMKVALVGLMGLACVCILLTGSRAGLLGLSFCTLLCLISTGRVKTALALFVLVAALAPLAWFALPADLQNRYETIIDPSVGPKNAQESAEGRMDGLVYGFEAWQKNPVLGNGPGGFKYATGREGGAHNLYGQILSEVGALGALAFLGQLLCFWLNSVEVRRFHREHPEEPRTFATHLTRALGLNILLLLFFGMSGHNLFRYYWLWFAAFQVAALHCIRLRAARAHADAWAPVSETPETYHEVAAGLS